MQATNKRLIGSVFPSGRWILTGQTGEIISCDTPLETLQQFAARNDCSHASVDNRIEWHWPAAMFALPAFNDRGSRLTFDREHVTDDEIRMALAHAEQKYAKEVMLTGDDPVFTARMAALADDMGLRVLNPELQVVMAAHREKLAQFAPNVAPPMAQKPTIRKLHALALKAIEKLKAWAK